MRDWIHVDDHCSAIYTILEKIYGDDLLIIGDVHVDLIFDLINSSRSNSFTANQRCCSADTFESKVPAMV